MSLRPQHPIQFLAALIAAFLLWYALAAERIDIGNPLDGVAPELDPHRHLILVNRKDLNSIAPYTEGSAGEVHVVAAHVDQFNAGAFYGLAEARDALQRG